MTQEPEELDWLDSFAEQHNALATVPMDAPERAAPIPMAPELAETDDWLDSFAAQEAGITLGDLGFKSLPVDRAQALLELAATPRTARDAALPDAENIPYAGFGFTLARQAEALLAQAKVKRGVATAEDEELYLSYLVDGARDSTYGAGVLDALYGIATTGLEVAGGAGLVSAAKWGTKKAAKAAGSKLFSEALENGAAEAARRKVAQVALESGAALAAATGLQEAVPQALGMGGGAWTLQSVQQLLGREMTDEEAQEIIDAKNALVPVLLEQAGGIMDGLIRQSITMGVEGLGPVLGKLPIVSQIDTVTGALFAKLAGVTPKGAWGKRVMEIAQQQGIGSEIAEEFADGILTAAVMGDKPILEALAEVAEQVPEMAGALAILRGGQAGVTRARGKLAPGEARPVKGAAGAEYVFKDGQWTKGGEVVMQAELEQEVPASLLEAPAEGTIYRVGAPEASATEGGDAGAAAPEVGQAEGAAVSEEAERYAAPLDESSVAAAEAFSEAASKSLGQEVRFRAVEPAAGEEADVARFQGRRGVRVTYVESDGADAPAGTPDAFFLAPDRAVVRRGASSIAGAAMDEAMHVWESQQTPERRAEYGAALRAIDPVFTQRVADWVSAQPLYKGASAAVLAEEQRTNVARFTAGLVMYLDTAQGRQDFQEAYAAEPSKFKRVLGALYDFVASKIRVLPQRKRALARARLRVARNEAQIPLVAQRILETLNELRGAQPKATSLADQAIRNAAPVESGVPAAPTQPLPQDVKPAESAGGESVAPPAVESAQGAEPGERFAAPPRGTTPRQFTWSEYFGRQTQAIPTVNEAARTPGRPVDVRKLDAPVSPQRVSQYLSAAVEASAEPETPREGTVGRPDLNVPLDTERTRALARAVDEVRKLDQETIPNAQTHDLARALYAADPDGARAMVEDRLARGEQLSAVDTVIATRVAQDLSDRALSREGTRDDHIDFLRWQNAYREARANTARSLQIVRGLGLAGQNALLDVLSMPTASVRREIRRVHKEAPGILGKRLKQRRSRFLVGQMGKPATGARFAAAAYDTQTGRPIAQERIDFLQAKLDAIEEAEADRMERAKQALIAAGYDPTKIDEAALLDPNEGWKIRRIISLAKSTRQDKLGEYVVGSMLSGIYTHVKNFSGNTANMILAGPVQLVAEAAANTVVRDKASAQWGDVKAYMQGFMHALKPAAFNAWSAWRTETPSFELELFKKGVPLDDVRKKLDAFNGPAISNPIIGRGLRSVSLNLLLAADEFAKTISATAWAHGLAYRQAKAEGLSGDALALRSAELLDDYTGDLWVEAAHKGRETTFQDDGNTFMERAVNTVLDMREAVNDISRNVIGLPVGTMVLPFVRTPLRIAATVVRRSPLQPLTYIGGFSGRYKHNTRQLVSDFADTMIAFGMLAAVMAMVDLEDDEGRPFITGSSPKNTSERELWQRLGAEPMSLRIGDSYYSYRNVEPLSTSIGVLADTLRRVAKTGDFAEAFSGVLSGLVAQSKDKTFLRTLGDLNRLAEESTSRTRKALDMASYSFVTVWVPNAIKQPIRAADPAVRESRQPREGESVWYEATRGLPYDALPIGPFAPEPKHDLWGRPIVKPGGTQMATGMLTRLLNPTPKVGDIDSATQMDLALLNFNNRVERGDFGDDARPVFPGAPSRDFTRDGVKYTYNPEEYVEYVRRSGETARARLEPMLRSGAINWREPDEDDIDRIEREIRRAREQVRRDLWRARRAGSADPTQLVGR